MQPNKPIKKRRIPALPAENNFYEAMPMSVGSHYVYRDDVIDQYRGADERIDESYDDTIKRVAIITLIMAAVIAVGVGILFIQGLSVINDSMPINQTSSGSLEL